MDSNNSSRSSSIYSELLIDQNDLVNIGKMKVEDYLNYQLKLQIDDIMNHMEKKIADLKENSIKKKEEIRLQLNSEINNESADQEDDDDEDLSNDENAAN
ncbi:hypothetical protein PPL_08808 [Heterostelium album PN500]|uniref:EKC/KEOPS complex subunit GON7 n=1 Tax=Heterostelium pallidum (strain ATCC 26659 / Pp 5 / PN500) TaxID=670386 RepID=D3BJS8_HETP5|nr:hypothetical protein PPL_08808 [Heterostelium album PN500]EFA78158.1 hypothetical protein PPL_08808 [Heterostelium album PN500]|eukprot:XP_020430284.1 hypothetical protein PPL_08808 [Heterostelium album PN500]